jgi:membrane fusion protein (multidrug efflux system)
MARVDRGGQRDLSSKREKPATPRSESPQGLVRAEPRSGEGSRILDTPPQVQSSNGGGDTASGRSGQDERKEGGGDTAAPKSKKSLFRRPLALLVLAIVIIGGVAGGIWYWSYTRQFETTDDAFIDAHITTVSPKVAGLVVEIPPEVDDNRLVAAGAKLLQIDPRDFELQVSLAKAALLSAQGKLEQSQAQVKVAEANAASARADVQTAEANANVAANDLRRYTALDPRAVSRQQLDTSTASASSTAAIVEANRKKADAAEAQIKLAATQVDTARADVETARVNLANAELQLSYATITAPLAGLVTRKDVQTGAYVQVGQALMSIVPQEVFVTANFKETQLAHMHRGDRVDVEVDALPGRTFHGHLDSIQDGSGARFSLLPPENATGNYVKVVQRVPVKIVFDDKPQDLQGLGPGMSVEPKVWTSK